MLMILILMRQKQDCGLKASLGYMMRVSERKEAQYNRNLECYSRVSLSCSCSEDFSVSRAVRFDLWGK